ncbi:MAG: MOSC domain-containing protein [Thaumarchaeota archaeon]|nr:MOSC domain-containing protein [Nitrososphaerota archaeon]
MSGRVFQINVKPQTPGERGLPKHPVDSVFVTKAGVRGDFNKYRHEERADDFDSAMLLMPLETLQQLESEGWPIRPGDVGENVTTVGLSYDQFSPGKVFRLGDARIQISRPCDPCTNLYLLPYVGRSRGPEFLRTMLGRRGWYARVLSEGQIKKNDPIEESVAPDPET